MLTSQDVLGEDGRIAARLPNYESRPEQLEMASAVERAITDKRHLLVEAGTGVGKSFAYLVPAILSAANRVADESQQQQVEANPNTGKPKRPRIVVSTNTISLQEQLILRDIPFLNAVLPAQKNAGTTAFAFSQNESDCPAPSQMPALIHPASPHAQASH